MTPESSALGSKTKIKSVKENIVKKPNLRNVHKNNVDARSSLVN